LQALEKLGYRVILAEYPGYGARDGSPSETTLISNGVETLKQALNDFGDPFFSGENHSEVVLSWHYADRTDSGKRHCVSRRHLIAWQRCTTLLLVFSS